MRVHRRHQKSAPAPFLDKNILGKAGGIGGIKKSLGAARSGAIQTLFAPDSFFEPQAAGLDFWSSELGPWALRSGASALGPVEPGAWALESGP